MACIAIHPGDILADELAGLGVTAAELAHQLNLPPDRIRRLVSGRGAITGDIALRLAHWFGTTPRFWLNLQSAYDIKRAEQAAGKDIAALPVRPGRFAALQKT